MAEIRGQYVVMTLGQTCHDCKVSISPGSHAWRGDDGNDRCMRCDRIHVGASK